DFLRMTQEFSQDAEENTCEVLASNALFRHCDALLPYTAAPKAPRVNLKPKEVLELQNRGPVYIIESGVVEAQVGDGPVVVLGAGQARAGRRRTGRTSHASARLDLKSCRSGVCT
ncbi:Repetitive proline-rich cell wall protein 2, partial [Durusdinium trenchii]